MTDDSTRNKGKLKRTVMDTPLSIKRSKPSSGLLNRYVSSVNLMKFAEISPLNPVNKPHPRSGHRAVATESDLWIWGGYYPSATDEQPRMFDEV